MLILPRLIWWVAQMAKSDNLGLPLASRLEFPTVGDDDHVIEYHDASRELGDGPGDWADSKLVPLSEFGGQAVRTMSPKVGVLVPTTIPPIRITESFEPVSATVFSSTCTDFGKLGGTAPEGSAVELGCSDGGVISTIEWASFGSLADASCPDFAAGLCSCEAAVVMKAVRSACVGKSECSVNASNAAACQSSDPCPGQVKTLAIRAVGCVPKPPPAAKVNRSTVFDFGQNLAGFCTLSGTGSGMMVTMVHSEALTEGGHGQHAFYPGDDKTGPSLGLPPCSMEMW